MHSWDDRPLRRESTGDDTVNTEKLRDWLEILGIFLVVLSLVFVGLEMRQAHRISLSQAYQSRTATAAEWNYELAANATALSGFQKANEGRDDEISPEERAAAFRMVTSVMYLYDNAHYQYQEGFVSAEFWETTRTALKRFMAAPTINTMVMARLEVQGRPEFKSVVLAINDELRAEANGAK